MDIRVGDIVECINATSNYITLREKYQVTNIKRGYIKIINDNGGNQWYFNFRFKLVPRKSKRNLPEWF